MAIIKTHGLLPPGLTCIHMVWDATLTILVPHEPRLSPGTMSVSKGPIDARAMPVQLCHLGPCWHPGPGFCLGPCLVPRFYHSQGLWLMLSPKAT